MQQGSKMYCPHCQGFGSTVTYSRYVTDGDRVPRILVLLLFMDFLIETRVLPLAERIYGMEGIQTKTRAYLGVFACVELLDSFIQSQKLRNM